jgi:transketolase
MECNLVNLVEKAKEIRRSILEMCCGAGTGHVTSSFSCTEIMVALFYGGILRFDPRKPDWEKRDRFILSKAQSSVILYPILADLGYFPREHLGRFCAIDGKFGVHLQHDVPGAEITAGSLGQGFGLATGVAMAAKLDRELHMTFCLLGDGECYEGSVWEAAMFAAHNRLNNLVAIIDRNYLCATNFTEDSVELEPLEQKWSSFGWRTITIDGHSFEQIDAALADVRSRKSSRPLAIIAETVKGKGVPFMCYKPLWHSVAPKGDEALNAKNELK